LHFPNKTIYFLPDVGYVHTIILLSDAHPLQGSLAISEFTKIIHFFLQGNTSRTWAALQLSEPSPIQIIAIWPLLFPASYSGTFQECLAVIL